MIVILYLVSITAAEFTTIFFNPQVGIIGYAVILFALILHYSRRAGQPGQGLFLSLALCPLIRMSSLFLPLLGVSPTYWYFIISMPLLAATLVVMRTLGLSRDAVGLVPGKVRFQLLVAATGLLFGFMEYHILKPEPLIARLAWPEILVPSLILLVSTGFVEEFTFRGLMQRTSAEVLGRWGLPYVSLLFAVLHIGHLSALDVGFVFVVGMFFAWAVERTGSLLGVTLSHGLTNILLFLVMPFL